MSSKKYIKIHPATVATYAKPVFLLMVFIFGGGDSAKAAVGAVFILLTAAFMCWRKIEIIVDGEHLQIKSGILCLKRLQIRLSDITCVITTRTALDFICGSTTISFFTKAGEVRARRRTRIYAKDEKEIVSRLGFLPRGFKKTIPFLQILPLALSVPSITAGAIFAIPTLRKIDQLIAQEETTIEKIGSIGRKFFGLSPLANIAIMLFLIIYIVSIVAFVVRQIKRSNILGTKTTTLMFGILPQTKVFVCKNSINGKFAKQTPLLYLLKRAYVVADIMGVDRKRSGGIYYSPLVAEKELPQAANVQPAGIGTRKIKNSERASLWGRGERWRYFTAPFYFICAITILSLSFWLLFPKLTDVIMLLVLAESTTAFYSLYLSEYSYKYATLDLSAGTAIYTKGKNIINANFIADRVGVIKITTFPYDRKNNTCSIKLILRSQNGEKIKLKYVSYHEMQEQMKKARVK